MTELGNRLKEAREAKGYTLDELQKVTKIQKRYLQGIEEGDYSSMPGSFYVRAFIKQYAEAVQLNPEELFETYSSDIPKNNDESIPVNLSRVKSKGSSRRTSPVMNFLPTVLGVGLLIGVIFVIWIVVQQLSDPGNQAENNADPETEQSVNIEQPEGTEEPAEEAPEESADANDEPAEEEPVEEEPPAEELSIESTGVQGEDNNFTVTNSQEELTLQIASDNSWITIRDREGNILYDAAVESGNDLNFDASGLDWVRVRVGNSSVTSVQLNGEPVEFGGSGVTQNMIFEIESAS
ncbi:RodZ domain-containing protein [Jeotgalibacillus sp. R-1-5s-1]|uniref:helix-turn-helix domain-containing protein n=1 Tax=Jeotgalibacillus sp. R-1-5s-1 TaxID=2555897 RepID=UPI00106C74C6|nr:RodZ domain-containing protein [Jeotgalibacillus sp. R-1-5s-1]TFE03432.1 helix-turn-helix domain-containing protein [Jeotgalibacillus sp. R-1-5s-1]